MTLDTVARATTFVDLAGLLVTGEVDGFDVDYLSWGFYAPAVWRNYAHTHSYFEVCLAYSGSGTFSVEGEVQEIEEGALFVARPGDVHEIISDPVDGLGIAFWGFTLQPTGATSASAPGWWSGLLRADRPLVSSELGSLPVLIAALAAEAAAPRSGVSEQLKALGTALVIETARAFAAPDDLAVALDPEARTTSSVASMERYLADNLARPVQVRDVAAVVHLSERHAARLFARETGESLMAMLRRLRLERGAHLLLETDDPIAQVARTCGYPEARPFITAFRRYFGQPPGTFRSNGGTLHL
ncbi:MAG: helix-turn-helix domain-containing protein [Brachybacterium tyrofermentans]|uniref:Helix-turn-helix domain-containing protein n=2 Tax=Brachybacterium tyrofermentans TaxID=47848 RepID=A0ABW0FJ29_9MICO|nr:AraC family transcriptional regulator [Brachybacterium tyrofermentans]SLN02387.1 Transcriptional regulator, AraC family [Corynebacterium xerosis]